MNMILSRTVEHDIVDEYETRLKMVSAVLSDKSRQEISKNSRKFTRKTHFTNCFLTKAS